MRKKRPAATNIGIDLDPEVIKVWATADIIGNNDSSWRENVRSTIVKKAVAAWANSLAPICKNNDVVLEPTTKDNER